MKRLPANGVRGADRDIGDCIEVNQAAWTVLDTLHGAVFSRNGSLMVALALQPSEVR